MFISTDTVKAAPGEERWLEVLGTLADSGRSLMLALLQETGFIPGVCEAATGFDPRSWREAATARVA